MRHTVDIVIALAPVIGFLAALWLMDSFQLVRPASVALALAWGAGSAAAGSFSSTAGAMAVGRFTCSSRCVIAGVTLRVMAMG